MSTNLEPAKQTAPTEGDSNGALREYRAQLVEAEVKAQTAFDRTVLTLSGGALGLSFAFVRDFIGSGAPERTEYLVAAWVGWVVSLSMVLASHYFSTLA